MRIRRTTMPKRILPFCLILFTSLYSAELTRTPRTEAKLLGTARTPHTQIKSIGEDLADSPEGAVKKLDFQDQHLFLPNLGTDEKYIISMCPMNSSGDSYHILAYLILAEHYNKKIVPKALLTHDESEDKTETEKQDTKIAAERTFNFAAMLGYGEYFESIQRIERKNSAQPNVRQAQLLTFLQATGDFTHFVDQKALTTLIAQHCFEYGKEKTQGILRAGFSRKNKQYKEVYQAAQDTKDEILKKLTVTGQPLTIIHARNSSYANKENTITKDQVEALTTYFSTKGHLVWVICIEGEEKPLCPQLKTQNKTSPFDYHREKSGYGMLYHLRLMLALQKEKNVKVIGNTSGALDLVAFLGHDVYNLQEWNGGMTYQYVRLLIGSAFLTVEFIQEDFFSKLAAADSGDASKIFTWLESKTINEDVDKKGLEDLKKKALPYTGQNTSKSTGTELPGFIELANVRRLSDSRLITLPSFETVLKNLTYFPAPPPTVLSDLSEEKWAEIYERAARTVGGDSKPRIAEQTVTKVKNKTTGSGFPGDDAYEKVVKIFNEIETKHNMPVEGVPQQPQQVTQSSSGAAQSQPVQKTALSELTDADWQRIKDSIGDGGYAHASYILTKRSVTNVQNGNRKGYDENSSAHKAVLAKAKELGFIN